MTAAGLSGRGMERRKEGRATNFSGFQHRGDGKGSRFCYKRKNNEPHERGRRGNGFPPFGLFPDVGLGVEFHVQFTSLLFPPFLLSSFPWAAMMTPSTPKREMMPFTRSSRTSYHMQYNLPAYIISPLHCFLSLFGRPKSIHARLTGARRGSLAAKKGRNPRNVIEREKLQLGRKHPVFSSSQEILGHSFVSLSSQRWRSPGSHFEPD